MSSPAVVAPHPRVPARAASHNAIREGVPVGAVGAGSVALWFALLDLLGGRPLYLPALLGALLTRVPDPARAALGPDAVGLALRYGVVHVLLFVLVGIAWTAVVHATWRRPSRAALALLVLGMLEMLTLVCIALADAPPLGSLAWLTLGGGHVVAVLTMGHAIARRHRGWPSRVARGLS